MSIFEKYSKQWKKIRYKVQIVKYHKVQLHMISNSDVILRHTGNVSIQRFGKQISSGTTSYMVSKEIWMTTVW